MTSVNAKALEFSYPPELPICAFRTEILDTLKKNNVIIVCGETGSGKTTQLPKMAMELGLGADGRKIACTQPRRVAATTVAERVAKELKTEIGGIIGYQHRFDRKLSDLTRVKFMTDGVLLTETLFDPLLSAYDTIIIDEAHERTLNIDFLLGIVKRISEKRRDLKIIISSATLDTERFSKFFSNAPTVIVPGRLYPVEIVYQPCDDEDSRDLPRDVARAARNLPHDDDILVFLPGERDIRETADALKRDVFLGKSEIIPLYASLPPGELKRAFITLDKRRIVLATNVAETSLTIPGIKAVIDSGLARISRYIHRTRVQRLQIEPISRASARQRAGRCGRIAPGTCVRLYSEEDFNTREEFTPPEILRSSLAGVILTMLELRLGAIDSFPFIDPPKPTMIREGLRELLELGAICRDERSDEVRLTKTGRRLARIPLEPRLARMLIAASDLATLPSVLPVVAAMSCDNPKKRPLDEQDKADREHAKWRVQGSDFLGTLELWKWWNDKSSSLSATQLRKLATSSYLSYPKMREWRELVTRLTSLAAKLKLDTVNDNGGVDQFHRALLPALLGKIGKFDPETNEFKGAHGIRFQIHPSSVLAKRFKPQKTNYGNRREKTKETAKETPSEWIMAGELVDTSRLFARDVAKIDPSWIEPAAGDMARRSYYAPEWDAKSGFVRAKERVTVYGLVIVDGRRRDFSRIDPVLSRKLFILHALVLGEIQNPPSIVWDNIDLLKELEKLSEQRRNRDLFDTEKIASHFDRVIPEEIVSVHELKKWLHGATQKELKSFRLNRDEWLGKIKSADGDYPETISIGGAKLKLEYRHTPDDPERDGITCTAMKSDAGALTLWRADWLVPGALGEKVATILNSLPSSLRRALPGINETLSLILPMLKPADEPLKDAIRHVVYARLGVRIPVEIMDGIKIPDHLIVRFRIRDNETRKIIASSRNLREALEQAGVTRGSATNNPAAKKYTSWDFGEIRNSDAGSGTDWGVKLYKALYDEGNGITVRLFKTEETAKNEHAKGTARLLALEMSKFAKRSFSSRSLSFPGALYFKSLNYAPDKLSDDIFMKAVRIAAVDSEPRILSAEAFAERIKTKRADVNEAYAGLAKLVSLIFEEAGRVSSLADAADLPDDIALDISTQLAWLVYRGFVATVPYEKLKLYPRYFKALEKRIERAKVDKTRDRSKMARFEPYWTQYYALITDKNARIADRAALSEYRWLLEEYRISLFAQEMKTADRVSPDILSRLWIRASAI